MLLGGLGARGFLWAPLLAELVVSQALGEPLPVERQVADLLDPDRFRRRAIAQSVRRAG
jgi:tRNA 5-methylaminomethyl-2-thiouridine biosynthesis bifunctional protein